MSPLTTVDVIAVPAYRPLSRARPPGADSALSHANRLPNACRGFTTMTKQEGSLGPRPSFINQFRAAPRAPSHGLVR